MDPSLLNMKNRAPSIVKKAPVTDHDDTPTRNRPEWLKAHANRPETRHNRYQPVTQRYLFRATRVESPLWGDAVRRGDDDQ